MIYDAIIIGAGLAGCSAAIQLADRGHKILLLEQQRYPAHKLCGEFLSIEVLNSWEFSIKCSDQVPSRLITHCSPPQAARVLPAHYREPPWD
jgi:flavin-dependent dehydrogenase